jgi:hypothetical protein
MAGKLGRISFVDRARRARSRHVVLLSIALGAAALVPVATADATIIPGTPACNPNPGRGNVWGSDVDGVRDDDNLLAGTAVGTREGYSMIGAAQDMGAWAYYKNNVYGYDSKNRKPIDVAVIDSGVAPVLGLNGTNVVHGPDLSFEAQTAFAHIDTFGHGTMMASLIAGRDSTSAPQMGNPYQFNGIAPQSRVVSLKVADSQGAVDATQMIAAIDWVVTHAKDPASTANPTGFNIRVISLSYGVQSIDDSTKNLLSYAVDRAWKKGIVVVAAAGNSGGSASNSGLLSPAYNRNIIAVGAFDTNGTPAFTQTAVATGSRSDDFVPEYTSGASRTNTRLPDFVAPGQHVVGLHTVGGAMDDEIYRSCWNMDDPTEFRTSVFGPNDRFVRGSGTSQAAALTSGAVALMLSHRPDLTPDQVKRMLENSAQPFGGGRGLAGDGAVNLAGVYNATSIPSGTESWRAVVGGGKLSDMRASAYVEAHAAKDPVNFPTACTDTFLLLDNPKYAASLTLAEFNLISARYKYYCVRTRLLQGLYQKSWIDIAKLNAHEATGTAWRTVPGTTIQQWSGDPLLALGTGFIDDPNKDAAGQPILGKVWAHAAWPQSNWAGQPWAKSTEISWDTPAQRWSLRSSTWSRFSLTGRDWTRFSLRDNTWS